MYKPGMVAQASNSSLWEAEGGSIRKVLKVSCGYLLHSRPARDMEPLLKRREVGGWGEGKQDQSRTELRDLYNINWIFPDLGINISFSDSVFLVNHLLNAHSLCIVLWSSVIRMHPEVTDQILSSHAVRRFASHVISCPPEWCSLGVLGLAAIEANRNNAKWAGIPLEHSTEQNLEGNDLFTPFCYIFAKA